MTAAEPAPATPSAPGPDSSAALPASAAGIGGDTSIPHRLRSRLQTAYQGIVAPVGIGLGIGALCDWAHANGRGVLRQPPSREPKRWLWCPARRSELTQLGHEHAGALVLADTDLLLDAEDWIAALPGQTREQALATFEACGGWPAALPLALARPGDALLHLHPLAAALLGPLLPPPPWLADAQKLAHATLVTPAVAPALGVERASVHALHDGGWLWHAPQGWTFPPTLRRLLCPHPEIELARRVAQALADDGHVDDALHTLADAAAWGEYLELLTGHAKAGHGEAALRARLQPLPERWRARPKAAYVAGLLARAAGDLPAAAELYTRSLAGAARGDPLAAHASNARGVVFAMQGRVDEALLDFDLAADAGGLTGGEACRNRATLLVQRGRHDEAEASLRGAIAAFRAAGDTLREARSLETLGGLQFGRGLLREALGPYRKALELLLPRHPDDGARIQINLAECHLGLGETEAAQACLRDAALLNDIVASPLVAGWLDRVRALALLDAGEPAAALARLDTVRTDDSTLRAEIALLRAQALRQLGDRAAAHAAWQDARSLGLRADLELALQDAKTAPTGPGRGGPGPPSEGARGARPSRITSALDDVIEAARREKARWELALGLLHRGRDDDLAEALELIRNHGYHALLESPLAAPLAALAHDEATRALFPLRLQAFGPLRATHAGRTVQLADFPARKSAALLVALALARHPQPRERLAERFWPDAKNPIASLQTAVYHLRATFGMPIVGGERGLLTLLFPVASDVAALEVALRQRDDKALAQQLRRMKLPTAFLPDLPSELEDERAHAERLLLDALRLHADAQPAGDVQRRDALRLVLASDPLDTESREELIRWHEREGEPELAEQERRMLKEAKAALGLG